jgi:hypothetical protein
LRAHKRNGGRHCCQPPLRRAKDMPVFVTWSLDLSACRPALDPGSPAQASLPTEQLPLARSRIVLLDCAARRFAGLSTFPARLVGTEVPRSQNRPVLCGPSWVDHSCVPLCSPTIRRPSGAASRLRKIDSSGASSRLAPKRTEALSTACRRRSDLWSPAALFLPLRAFRGGRDRRPDHPCTMHPGPESGKRKMRRRSCG